MTALFKTPPVYDLPFTKGDDLSVRFIHKEPVLDDDGQPVMVDDKPKYVVVDYPDGAAVTVQIDTLPVQQVVAATIEGSAATIQEKFTVIDTIPAGVKWRVKIIYAGGLTKVAAHGLTVRDD